MAALTLHPDRLLPADPGVRFLARRLYETVRDLPIVSPHGHVDPRVLLDDQPFADPTSLFLQPDHYVTRLLHSAGVPLSSLGVGRGPLPESEARAAWRLLCEHWDLLRGTPVQYWLSQSLAEIFGVTSRPSRSNSDEVYDQVSARLTLPTHRPRALFERFGISFLATTDDPADDLSAHQALRGTLPVVPTFRPDRYLEVGRAGWTTYIKELGGDVGDYAGFIASLEARRRFFISQGAVSADHGHFDAGAEPLDRVDAERIYRSAVDGTVTAGEATVFRRHMIFEMARMSCEDGLVMTLHPGIYRNHHPSTLSSFGPDTGHDIPVGVEFTRALQPLLERFGTYPGFHLVLFTVDATVYSREIAPLAGFYPSVYAGAPWWFLDNPSEIRAYQRAVTEISGFSRMSGFIDDTRAFCSIPARHDMSRRLDAGFLASLVAEHRLDEEEALDTLTTLVADQPRAVFKI